jgi:hypothetical protein
VTLRSVLLGGLVAGLLINVSGMALAHFVLGPDYVKAFVQHLPGPPGAGTFVRHLAVRFGFGFLAVLLFALLRPGLGSAAAPAAAGFLFFASYLTLALALSEFGILGGWRLWVSLVWGAAEVLLATLAGAFVYLKTGGAG